MVLTTGGPYEGEVILLNGNDLKKKKIITHWAVCVSLSYLLTSNHFLNDHCADKNICSLFFLCPYVSTCLACWVEPKNLGKTKAYINVWCEVHGSYSYTFSSLLPVFVSFSVLPCALLDGWRWPRTTWLQGRAVSPWTTASGSCPTARMTSETRLASGERWESRSCGAECRLDRIWSERI